MKKRPCLSVIGAATIRTLFFSMYAQAAGPTAPHEAAHPSGPPKPEEITIDPSNTAFLMLHWQNEIVRPNGKISGPLPVRLAAARTLENTLAALNASREKGMLVAHVVAGHRPGYPELPQKRPPLVNGIVGTGAMVRGSWGAAIIDEFKPLDDECIVTNYSPSAFAHTDLDLLLRNKGISNVVLTGLVTNWVIESTGRDAVNNGYFVYTLADCCNSFTDSLHEWSTTNVLPLLGALSDSARYVEALKKVKPVLKKPARTTLLDINKIDSKKTALLLLHLQNDIVSQGGKLATPEALKRIAECQMIERIQSVLKTSREKGMLVFYVNASHRLGYPELSEKPAPLIAGIVKAGALIRGTWGAEVTDRLKPLRDEIIIDNSSTSAFTYTDLDMILRNKGITDVVLAGLVTNVMMESTARDAVNRGYFCHFLKDCSMSFTDELHNWTVANVLPMFGNVIDSRTYIDAVGEAK